MRIRRSSPVASIESIVRKTDPAIWYFQSPFIIDPQSLHMETTMNGSPSGTLRLENEVVLVDASGKPIGQQDKLTAHRLGQLHLAVSVFVFDGARRLLLQRRAGSKYHSGGLW